MKMITQAIAVSVLLNWTAIEGGASELLLNRPPNTSDLAQGLRSDLSYEAPGSPLQQMADRFSLVNPAVITAVSWWGFYLPASTSGTPQPVQFQIRMFTDQAGTPSASPFYEATVFADVSPFSTVQGQGTQTFSAQLLTPFAAQTQTDYWLSVVESDVRTDGAFNWFNSGPARSPIGFASRASDGDNWAVFANAEQMSFSLSGAVVPEPAVPALLALGAVIILLYGPVEKNRLSMGHVPDPASRSL